MRRVGLLWRQGQAGTVSRALLHMLALGMEDPIGGIVSGQKKDRNLVKNQKGSMAWH